MKNLKFTVNVITVLFLVSLLSCGPNDQERLTAEKVKMDSIELAVRASIADSIAIANGVAALKKTKEWEREEKDNKREKEKFNNLWFLLEIEDMPYYLKYLISDKKIIYLIFKIEKKLINNWRIIKYFYEKIFFKNT